MKNIVSHTTREPREGELHGVDYYFVSEEEFNKTPMAAWFGVSSETGGKVIGKYGVSMSELEDMKTRNGELFVFLGRSASGKTSCEKAFSDKNIISIISESYAVDLLINAEKLDIKTRLVYFHASRLTRMQRMIDRGDSYENILRRFMIEDIEPEIDLIRIGTSLRRTPLYVVNGEIRKLYMYSQVEKIVDGKM